MTVVIARSKHVAQGMSSLPGDDGGRIESVPGPDSGDDLGGLGGDGQQIVMHPHAGAVWSQFDQYGEDLILIEGWKP